MAGVSLRAILRAIIRSPDATRATESGSLLPPVMAGTPVTVAAVPIKMHRDEASHHGKPYPIALKPSQPMSPFSDRSANIIAMPETWY
jgi:hypothetical protein